MKIDIHEIEKPKSLLTHLLMENEDIAKAVALTKRWTKDGLIDVSVSFNDIIADAKLLDNLLTEWGEQITKEVTAKYADIEAEIKKRVETKLKDILEDKAKAILETMDTLQTTLNYSEGIIKPSWID